jgi:fatty acid desaturase
VNRQKADVLDHFVSRKVLAGPSSSAASAPAREALRDDPLYRELKSRLEAIGFFTPAPWGYAWRMAVNFAICVGGWVALVLGDALWLQAIGVIAIGISMVQSSFLAHDAAHGALTRKSWLVELVGQLHSTLFAGFSFSYFRRSHDLHHFHTNEQDVDPDCLSNLFSVNEESARRKTGLGRFITRYQGVLIPVLFPMWALAMKWDGLCFLARSWRRCWRDVVALGVHVAIWLVVPALLAGPAVALGGYLVYNGLAGIYLGAVIPVNHVATTYLMPDHEMSFVEHQLATCRDIRPPGPRPVAALFDFMFIGLNRQIEHHLFPWAPVSRLASGARVIREVCREHGLPYRETTYSRAAWELAQHFARIGRQASRHAAWRLSSESPPV